MQPRVTMPEATDHSPREYCADLVKTRDEDRWLAAGYAGDAERRKLLALYAFHCELRRIPSAVSEPALGEIRLQWWREALDEIRAGKRPRAHPAVEELAAAGFGAEGFAERIERVIDAHARPLYGEGFGDIADLTAWLEKTDGAVDALAAVALDGGEALAAAAEKAGAGFALAREGRVLAPTLADDISPKALTAAAEAAPVLRKAPGAAAPAVLHLALTRAYARRGERPFPTVKRLRLFSAMAFGWF